MRDDSPRVVLSWGDPSRRRVWQKCHSKQEEMSCVITLLQMRPGAESSSILTSIYTIFLEGTYCSLLIDQSNGAHSFTL